MSNSGAYVNIAFDKIIRTLEESRNFSRLLNKVDYFGCQRESIEKRILQRLVELGYPDFAKNCKLKEMSGQKLLPSDDDVLDWSGIQLDQQSSTIRISSRVAIKMIADSFLRILQLVPYLFYFGRIVGPTRGGLESATLLMGVGVENVLVDNDDARFVDFCKHGPIKPLSESRHLIVQYPLSPIGSGCDDISYVKYPLHVLIASSKIGFFNRLWLLLATLTTFIRFILLATKSPVLLLVARDVPYIRVVQALEASGAIESVVFTNSSYNSQPLWFRELKTTPTHMVWYAQNTKPFVYKPDDLASDFPAYRHLAVDESWVWTQQFADYIDRLIDKHIIHIVGPILWYLEREEEEDDDYSITSRIGVFDMTPVTKEVALSNGVLTQYCSTENMTAFIDDILRLKDTLEKDFELAVEVSVKAKRQYNSGHDRFYINKMRELKEKGRILLPPHNVNSYSFISSCFMVIVVPNSSPALVADYLGVPAVYYDPTELLAPNNETGGNIWFASGYNGLLAITLDLLQKRKLNCVN